MSKILYNNDFDEVFLRQQVHKTLTKGLDFCDIYLQNTLSESWRLEDRIIKSGAFSINCGVGVRGVAHNKSFLNYSNSISKSSIINLIDNLFFEQSNKGKFSVKIR